MRLRSGSVGFFTDHYALLLYYSFLQKQSMKLTTSCLTLDAVQSNDVCCTRQLNYCTEIPQASGMFHGGFAPTKRLKTTGLDHVDHNHGNLSTRPRCRKIKAIPGINTSGFYFGVRSELNI